MPIYRTKPCTIQAFRMGQRGEPTPAPEWFPSPPPADVTPDGVIIHTLEGDMLARWGDYVIQGLAGELYPCKPEIFERKYELVASNNGS